MGGARKKKKQPAAAKKTVASTSVSAPDLEVADFFWDKFELPSFDQNGETGFTEWVSKLETFFEFTGKPDPQKIVYAANLLTGGAHAKWRSLMSQVSAGKERPVKTWEEFKTHIGRLTEGNSKNDVVEADWVVRQGSSGVSNYTRKFFGSRKLGRYVAGLNPKVAEYVTTRNPKDFQEAASLAYEWELNHGKPEVEESDDSGVPEEDGECSSSAGERWIKGKVNGVAVTCTLNSASDCLVSDRLVKLLGLPIKNKIARDVRLMLRDEFSVVTDFIIADLPRHDMVLGLAFFSKFDRIGFHADHVTVNEHKLELHQGPVPVRDSS